jgi:hypothetical protein
MVMVPREEDNFTHLLKSLKIHYPAPKGDGLEVGQLVSDLDDISMKGLKVKFPTGESKHYTLTLACCSFNISNLPKEAVKAPLGEIC